MTSDDIIVAARRCIGVPFRPYGRNPAFGLDCVGLAGVAFARDVPGDYSLHGGTAEGIAARVDALRLVCTIVPEPGDLVLILAGPNHYHFAILTGTGFVHADARLRRIVETPGRPDPIVAAWREPN